MVASAATTKATLSLNSDKWEGPAAVTKASKELPSAKPRRKASGAR